MEKKPDPWDEPASVIQDIKAARKAFEENSTSMPQSVHICVLCRQMFTDTRHECDQLSALRRQIEEAERNTVHGRMAELRAALAELVSPITRLIERILVKICRWRE